MSDPTKADDELAMTASRSLGDRVFCRHGRTHQPRYNCEACTAKVIAQVIADERLRIEDAINDASEKPDYSGSFTRGEVIAAIREGAA